MNNITYQPTGIFKQFEPNYASLQKTKSKDAVSPAENDSNNKIKRIAIRTAVGIGAIALGAGLIYYHKASKVLKLPEQNPIIQATQEEFENYVMKNNLTQKEREFFEMHRSQYSKHLRGVVGKIYIVVRTVQNFFKKNFFNY